MKFTIFNTHQASKGELLTADLFEQVSRDLKVETICAAVATETNHKRQQEIKKQLPVITWQAYFEGARKNDLAQPSGLFILDVDGIDNPYKLWSKIIGRSDELGIMVAHKTPSMHGLRLVCKCRPEFTTIDECQQWLAKEIGVEHDAACKDWARASYVVPASYVYYLDQKVFIDEPGVVYSVNSEKIIDNSEGRKTREASPECLRHYPGLRPPLLKEGEKDDHTPTFKGIALGEIAREWLEMTGGEPVEGERNTRLHALAFDLRYITDFDEAKLLAVMPDYGLEESEMKTLIKSACNAPRSKGLPKTLKKVLEKLTVQEEEHDEDFDEDLNTFNAQLTTTAVPIFPPLIRQLAQTAPDDFRLALVMCTLPILGTLGSKLRAKYLDGHLHSPSFQVSLEAPQASGKSFMTRLADQLMAPIINRDKEERQREQEYNEKSAELKLTGVKVTPENKDELLGQRPKGIIRYVPATISITKLLMRLDNARGLHLFALAEEIDTVTKAFKRSFSSYGDLLRVAFDNARYGQDYASDTSFSGIVNVYYNTLFSGTPKAMKRFYPDVEDGLISRVCFVTLPDQFGKKMPQWGELSEKDQKEVEQQMERLDQISIQGDTVQPDHVMNLDFLNRAMDQWLDAQQQEARRTNDRTRDVFCRRAAVVGFRAGMLAWFLYGEKNTVTSRRNTVAFARWIASQMLTQHLLRFQIDGKGGNINCWEEVYKLLGDEFTRDEAQQAIKATGVTSSLKLVLYRWRLLGSIEALEEGRSATGKRQTIRFRKLKGGSVVAV
jgi:hypothetical protein